MREKLRVSKSVDVQKPLIHAFWKGVLTRLLRLSLRQIGQQKRSLYSISTHTLAVVLTSHGKPIPTHA
ncbi:hypothetical protein JTE90_027881 [Oedothorax gibbosus]|uniref:Uncharacterized protein n=1 Tax=Oedothorax gibbosus TaxID=931172 RepID=A0AAV6U6D8_9ARAC|nr:hypothetical protein JTE90_027881 [Oedothorax gibbosus]